MRNTEQKTIEVTVSDLKAKIKQHLAVIGKRAKDINGKPMYSDLTTSTAEDAVVWDDLIKVAADLISSELGGSRTIADGTITFYYDATKQTEEENIAEKTRQEDALKDAVTKFVWNYAIKEYLSMIHPSTGEKYPPIFASPYQSAIATSLLTIQSVAYSKRRYLDQDKTYADVTGTVVND